MSQWIAAISGYQIRLLRVSPAGSVNLEKALAEWWYGADVKRVLIYRLGSLGDTVVALPALHLIERAFPNAERRMLTNFPVSVKAPAAAAILAESGLVHGYFRYAIKTRSPKVSVAALVEHRALASAGAGVPGAARGIESARRDARFFRLCGIHSSSGCR